MLGRVMMQHTTCTEDRIQHALDRCLDGLRSSEALTQSWNSGWCMNRWSLEELLKRDPENFLILLQQILRRTREVQQEGEYELVAPLVIMFKSTLLQTPYCPPDAALLTEACEVFHGFLTWPEPYASSCRHLLATLQHELRAPGISYHRLVREEQGLVHPGELVNQRCRTITVLLMNPTDVPPPFLSVVEQMGGVGLSQRDTTITLLKHAFQATLGSKYPLSSIHLVLQSLSEEELTQTLWFVTDLMESAASMADGTTARAHVVNGLEELQEKLNIPACSNRNPDGMLQILRLPTAKCYTIRWETDSFDVLNQLLEAEPELASLKASECPDDEGDGDADEEEELDELEEYVSNGYVDPRASMSSTASSLSTASKDSMFSIQSVASGEGSPLSTLSSSSQASGTDSDFCEEAEEDSPAAPPPACNAKSTTSLSKRLSHIFRPRSSQSLSRAKSLGMAEAKDFLPAARSKRSNSVPQQAPVCGSTKVVPEEGALEHLGPGPGRRRRRPILSSDDGEGPPGAALLRVLAFGADHVAGRVARAYSSLRKQEKDCPRLSRAFRMRFFFVPVRRDPVGGGAMSQFSSNPLKAGQEGSSDVEDSTNDIAHLLASLDPWYERNTHCLLELPLHIVCRQTSRPEPEFAEVPVDETLPILADLLLYYCRNAARPALLQLYQAELTLAGGEMRTEVFIHSLELGHTAGTRAVKAMGAASKRFGIDGDREAVPLSLELVYNQVVISGRCQKTRAEKVCTSINLTKACRNPEELDPKMECLQLTVTEVLKRQNSKSKKSYNQQLSITRVKVDKVRVRGSDNTTTFAVCFDQDEKKILQSVTRCEVSVCYKPETSADWLRARTLSTQFQTLQPTFCSLLCLPIATFSGAQP